MMMRRSVRAVAVAMADFFISCIANVKDLDIKGCGDTSQGMVSIDINIEFAHFHDHDISRPVRCIDFNGHTPGGSASTWSADA